MSQGYTLREDVAFLGQKANQVSVYLLFLIMSKLRAVQHFQDWTLSCIVWLMEKEGCKFPCPELWFVLRFV